MNIDIGTIDFKMLREQKQALLETMHEVFPETEKHLQGILNLIDHIQDESAKQIGENSVFDIIEECVSGRAETCKSSGPGCKNCQRETLNRNDSDNYIEV